MKPFNLDEAKAGKQVCTRKSKNVRIVCFDVKSEGYPLLGLITLDDSNCEHQLSFTETGHFYTNHLEHEYDLFIKSEKKEGWINLFRNLGRLSTYCDRVYDTYADACWEAKDHKEYFTTVKIEWEE